MQCDSDKPSWSEDDSLELGNDRVALSCVVEDQRWLVLADLARLIEHVLVAVSRTQGLIESPVEGALLFSNDVNISRLNKQFRNKPKATNVLSFPADARFGQEPEGRRQLGDVILAYETIDLEAAAAGIPIENHVQHLILHGLLHLLGFDHQDDAEAEAMEGLEVKILAELGLPNPYVDPIEVEGEGR